MSNTFKILIFTILFSSCFFFKKENNSFINSNEEKVKINCDSLIQAQNKVKRIYSNELLNIVIDSFRYLSCKHFDNRAYSNPIIYDIELNTKNLLYNESDFNTNHIYGFDDFWEGNESIGGIFYIKKGALHLFNNLDMKDSLCQESMYKTIENDFKGYKNMDTIKIKIITRRRYAIRMRA
jgi:hypothetical protein